ncbi:hypothetical protein Glo7428_2037 [Gloeocapsa sp. PCC 7428]|uniref:transposase n=1 Tax=Gloeocapsa sp. PCC 7428 TaxID=1173026 RepID=UPI0002A5FA65|nr:transposase [Gloeocapsa sp. PCC 7428]AFZ30581.1 hypothetical protein Glo7428_2037 [Gloeocapsa sp. PCC 7428]
MKYDPEKHHRRSIRLKGYDYSSVGAYFITICTHQRRCLFGVIRNGVMELNAYGQIVAECWQQIPQHFSRVQLDAFVVMPNHVHGILMITNNGRDMAITNDGRDMAMPCPYQGKFGKPIPGSLPTMIGSFKSAATKRINIIRSAPKTPVWQKNYYERIIHDKSSLPRVRHYIQMNPIAWENDRLHPQNPD